MPKKKLVVKPEVQVVAESTSAPSTPPAKKPPTRQDLTAGITSKIPYLIDSLISQSPRALRGVFILISIG